MKQTIMYALVAAGILAIPALGLAATYQYVDSSGEVRSMTADTAAEALLTAPDIAPRSGVMLVTSPATDIPPGTDVVL